MVSLLRELDLLDLALEHLGLLDRGLSILALPQQLLHESLGEVLRFVAPVDGQRDLGDRDLADLEVVL